MKEVKHPGPLGRSVPRVGPQAPDDDRHVQHEPVAGVGGVPADLLAHPPQAVADGVGVDEQGAGGGLQAPAQGQVCRHRLLEGLPHGVQGRAHQGGDLLGGELVPVQQALGQQVVGVDGVGGVGPAGSVINKLEN